MNIEPVFNMIRDCLKEKYPHKASVLDEIAYLYIEDSAIKSMIAYEAVRHAIFYTPRFLAQFAEPKEYNSKMSLDLTHQALHEFTHAVSFRKLTSVDTPHEKIESGIQINKRVNGTDTFENMYLNEIMTNYFTFQVMSSEELFYKLPGATAYLEQCKKEVRVVRSLIEIVGEDAVRAAYFEGNLRQFAQRLERKKINSVLLLALLGSSDGTKQARGLQMIGLKGSFNFEIVWGRSTIGSQNI